MPTKYDLAIIGSGGGAFAAAIRASTLGKSVVMIERGTLGGTCVNTGCVPSKALIAAAGARHVAVDAATRFPGIATTADPVDMPALIAGKQALVESLRGEKYADVADSYGWHVRRGDAGFAGTPDAPVLEVTAADGAVETIEAEHYLVATGARPWAPPIDGLDEAGYLTSTTAMELTEVPESLLVLGGGYVALEQAQLFARLGSQVTLLVRSRLASKEEPEVSKALQEVFADEGIRVVSRAVPTRVSRGTGGEAVVTAALSGGSQEFRADQVLVALVHELVALPVSAAGRHDPNDPAAGRGRGTAKQQHFSAGLGIGKGHCHKAGGSGAFLMSGQPGQECQPHPLRGKTAKGGQRCSPQIQPCAAATQTAHLQRLVTKAMAFVQKQQLAGIQIARLGTERAQTGDAVLAARQKEGVGEQRNGSKFVGIRRRRHDRRIQSSLGQFLDQPVCLGFPQMQVAADVAGAQDRQRLGQQIGRHGRDHAQHQPPAPPRLAHRLVQPGHGRHDAPCMKLQRPALGRQHHARRRPFHDGVADLILQRPDLHG